LTPGDRLPNNDDASRLTIGKRIPQFHDRALPSSPAHHGHLFGVVEGYVEAMVFPPGKQFISSSPANPALQHAATFPRAVPRLFKLPAGLRPRDPGMARMKPSQCTLSWNVA
jgi:hypothetical protein